MDKYLIGKRDQPAAYSEEALRQVVPHTSLLDRIHAEVCATATRAAETAEFVAHDIEADHDDDDDEDDDVSDTPFPRHRDGSFVAKEIRENVMFVEECESGVIPSHTNELCQWDLQPFEGVPFVIPVKVDRQTRKILVVGYCCSVSCAISLMRERAGESSNATYFGQMLVQFAKDYFGAKYTPELTLPAPPRQKLSQLYAKFKKSGVADPMGCAIAEFRNGSEKLIYHFHPPVPFIRVTHRVDEEVLQKAQQHKHKKRLDLMSQTPKPIACTRRGMQEQRKYVLSKRDGTKKEKRGAIDALMGIKYRRVDDDSD